MSSVLNGGGRLTNTTTTTNGLKMVSGFKEHLNLALSKTMPEQQRLMTTAEPTTGDHDELQSIIEAKQIIAAAAVPLDEEEQATLNNNSEIRHMKELLLIHLDYIQQQSEQLTTKEKRIVDLMHENEMLKLRIDRMERRVALQRNRPSASAAAGSSSSSSSVENGHVTASTSSSSSGGAHDASGALPRKRRRQSADSLLSNNNARGKRLLQDSKRLQDARRNRKRDDGDGSPSHRDNHLLTETAYYTTIGNQNCTWSPHIEYPSKEVLEVPRWRMKLYTSSYTMEGTENLSEDVFSRRHYRFSIDEKRRKRWDVQRIREQRQNERLRQREKMRQGGDGEEDSEFQSFWPQPHPSLVLSVHDTIPVSVFGIRLAPTPVAEFSLPWLTGKDSTLKSLRSFSKRKR